jgi:hypothetical protein
MPVSPSIWAIRIGALRTGARCGPSPSPRPRRRSCGQKETDGRLLDVQRRVNKYLTLKHITIGWSGVCTLAQRFEIRQNRKLQKTTAEAGGLLVFVVP